MKHITKYHEIYKIVATRNHLVWIDILPFSSARPEVGFT